MQPHYMTDPRCKSLGVQLPNRVKLFDQLFCKRKFFQISYQAEGKQQFRRWRYFLWSQNQMSTAPVNSSTFLSIRKNVS